MNCIAAQELMWEVAGGELDGERADAVRDHARQCVACGQLLTQFEATVSLTRRVGTEPLPDGFTLELHRKLVAAGPPRLPLWERLRARVSTRSLALVGCTALIVALIAVSSTRLAMRPDEVAHRVPEAKVALVKIDFVADRDVDDVQFEITLPDGLRFFSGGQQLAERSFRWQGKLSAGSNPIPIAVKGPRAGRYRVIAHAVGPSLDITHEVVLEVTA
jgi:hypothetical protein